MSSNAVQNQKSASTQSKKDAAVETTNKMTVEVKGRWEELRLPTMTTQEKHLYLDAKNRLLPCAVKEGLISKEDAEKILNQPVTVLRENGIRAVLDSLDNESLIKESLAFRCVNDLITNERYQEIIAIKDQNARFREAVVPTPPEAFYQKHLIDCKAEVTSKGIVVSILGSLGGASKLIKHKP